VAPEHDAVLEYFARQRRARIARLKAEGLCITCGKVRPPKGRVTCDDCNADATERQRLIRERRKKGGAKKSAAKPKARKKGGK
jgi:hypothetical protein